MIHSTVHVHSSFCDGDNTPHEMALAAFNSGLKCIGFSSHSYTELDDFGMKREQMPEYIAKVNSIKGEYEGRMQVLCGLELDAISKDIPYLEKLDYVIGSAHSVRADDGVDYVIDGSVKHFENNVKLAFGGSFEKMYEAYYQQFAEFLSEANIDIAGHFDLVTKYNEKYAFFDAESVRYKKAALTALDVALDKGIVIEVNTGAITRGYRTLPYPAFFLLRRILDRKGKVIITTDAHNSSAISAYTDEAELLLKEVGFLSVWEMSENGFYERAI